MGIVRMSDMLNFISCSIAMMTLAVYFFLFAIAAVVVVVTVRGRTKGKLSAPWRASRRGGTGHEFLRSEDSLFVQRGCCKR